MLLKPVEDWESQHLIHDAGDIAPQNMRIRITYIELHYLV